MNYQEPKKRITSTGIILIVMLLGIWLALRIFINPGGSGSGEFNSYRGPVLPMTSLYGADGVDVKRNVNFDFSPYQTGIAYATLGKGAAGITDTYVLTNTTKEARTLELVYGFQGQFIDHPEEFPTITVDGKEIQPVLFPSIDTEALVWSAHNFSRYSQVLEDNDFLATALQQTEELDVPVTAYHFTDLAYEGNEVAGFPMLTVQFSLNEDTLVWESGRVSSHTLDDGRTQMMFLVERREAWVFTVGGTLIDPEFGGNKDYNITETSAIDGVTFHLETFETTLSEAIRGLARNYDFWSVEGQDTYPNAGGLTTELLVDGTVKRILAQDYRKFEDQLIDIDGIFHDVVTDPCMMYLVFPVELAPGQSLTVEAAYIQEPSLDIGGPKHYREGYELATKLGSDLHFTDLTSSLSGTAMIELGKQNFGFDPERGITSVELDLQIPRYYLEVRLKK